MKKAVENDRYRIDRNTRRQDNINLFLNYIIDEAKAKEIILSLTVMDFSEILQNEHKVLSMKSYMYLAKISLFWRETVRKRKWYLFISKLTSWRTVL